MPPYLQQTTDRVIDSVYDWLNGKTPVPDFQIDVAGLKTKFATEAAKAAQAKAATLPVCAANLPSTNFDVFSATCLPRGLSPATVAEQVQGDINNNHDFLSDPTITADDIKSSDSQKTVFADQYKDAPKLFQRIKQTPVVLAVLAILTVLGIIFLSSTVSAGLRRASVIFVIEGVTLLVFTWLVHYAVTQKALPEIKMDNKVVQEDIKHTVTEITDKFANSFYMFSGTYLVLGASGVIAPMVAGRQGKKLLDEPSHATVDDKPADPTNPPQIEIESKKDPVLGPLPVPKGKAGAKTKAKSTPTKINVK